MSQMTFAEADYAHKKRKTRREIFLERTEAFIPWQKKEKKGDRFIYRHQRHSKINLSPFLTRLRSKLNDGELVEPASVKPA